MVQGSHATHSPFFPTEATIDRRSTKTIKIFGVAGDALSALTDALRKDGRIQWIGFRHWPVWTGLVKYEQLLS